MPGPSRGLLPVWALTDTEYRPRFKRKQKTRKHKGYNINLGNPANTSLYIGIIWIGTTNNTLPESVKKCKAIFINQADSDDVLLNLNFEESDAIIKITTDTEFLEG